MALKFVSVIFTISGLNFKIHSVCMVIKMAIPPICFKYDCRGYESFNLFHKSLFFLISGILHMYLMAN